MIGCLRTRVRKQPIVALYFESEDELKFYNLAAWFGDHTDDFYFKGTKCLKEKGAECCEVGGSILKNNMKTIFQSAS